MSNNNINCDHGNDYFAMAMRINAASVLPFVVKAAVELDLFEIMARPTNTCTDIIGAENQNLWSSNAIVACLPTKNPDALVMLERILRFLAFNNILTCNIVNDECGREKPLYGLSPISKYYVRDKDGVSLAPPLLLLQDKVTFDAWFHLKDAILEGGIPFNKAHGMHAFEYPAIDKRFNEVFNDAMYNTTTIIMKNVLDTYNGFEDVQEIVDVGGGFGQTLAAIISKYPHIKGINFDLPHVIMNASPISGVKHVGGNMFESVPVGEVIFLKWILHDWDDEHCLRLLRNCWTALPDCGKVIIVESMLSSDYSNKNLVFASETVSYGDMIMLALTPGGKERTHREFEALAIQAGFAASKLTWTASVFAVIEFHKNILLE